MSAAPLPVADLGVSEPYPGLRPFKVQEWPIFFGRKAQTDELLKILVGCRFLAVLGSSGCGKSSLVKAGLIARVTEEVGSERADWIVAMMRPQDRPMANLAAALARPEVLGRLRPSDDVVQVALEGNLKRGPSGLIEALSQSRLPPGKKLLLLVDQFEELFTFGLQRDLGRGNGALVPDQDNPELIRAERERSDFVQLLLESAKVSNDIAKPRVHVVVTMRSEYLGFCTRYEGLAEKFNEGQFLTPKLTREERQLSIEGPAEFFGRELSPNLVNRLLNDSSLEGDPLPLLQHALMRMWGFASRPGESFPIPHLEEGSDGDPETDPFADTSGPTTVRSNALPIEQGEIPPGEHQYFLNLTDYANCGHLAFALDRHAESVYRSMDPGKRRIARVLFRRLTGGRREQSDTRHATTISDVAGVADVPPGDVEEVVRIFGVDGPGFVVWNDELLGYDSVLDLAHESLIRRWTSLARWAESEAKMAGQYRTLVAIAMEPGSVLNESALQWTQPWRGRAPEVRKWATRYGSVEPHGDTPSDIQLAIDLVLRSRNSIEKQQRRNQVLKLMVLLVVVLMGCFAVIWYKNRRASENAAVALKFDKAKKAADALLANQKLQSETDELEAKQKQDYQLGLADKELRVAKALSDTRRRKVEKLNGQLVVEQKNLIKANAAREEAIRSVPIKMANLVAEIGDNSLSQGSLGAITTMGLCTKAINIVKQGPDGVPPSIVKTLRNAVEATSGFQLATDQNAPTASSTTAYASDTVIDDNGSVAVWPGTDGAFYVWVRGKGVTMVGSPKASYKRAIMARDGTHVLLVRKVTTPQQQTPDQSKRAQLQQNLAALTASFTVYYQWWKIKPSPEIDGPELEGNDATNVIALSNRPSLLRIVDSQGVHYVHLGAGARSTYKPIQISDPLTSGGELKESPNGHYLAVPDGLAKTQIFDISNLKEPRPLPSLNGPTYMVVFAQNEKRLAAYDMESKALQLYELPKPKPIGRWTIDELNSIGFTPTGLLLGSTNPGTTAARKPSALYAFEQGRSAPVFLTNNIDGVADNGLAYRAGSAANQSDYTIKKYTSATAIPQTYKAAIGGNTIGGSSNLHYGLFVDNGLPKISNLDEPLPDYSKASLDKLEARANQVLSGYFLSRKTR